MELATTDPAFGERVLAWLRERGEVLLLVRYSRAAGSRDVFFVAAPADLAVLLGGLPARASVIAFGERQLPVRGVVDDVFVARAVAALPEGAEYLLVATGPTRYAPRHRTDQVAGEGWAELRADLEEYRGRAVAVGPYPPWLEDTATVVEAIVPDADGVAHRGIY
jgi:hypothetical protein